MLLHFIGFVNKSISVIIMFYPFVNDFICNSVSYLLWKKRKLLSSWEVVGSGVPQEFFDSTIISNVKYVKLS